MTTEFTTNTGTYSVMCQEIPANEDRPAYWKIDVLQEGKRQNDVSYTITQQAREDIIACSGRDPLEELCCVAEADVVLGRNQISGPLPPHASTKLLGLNVFRRAQTERQNAMKEFIRRLFPSSQNPEDHQAQDLFNARRERFADMCAMEFGADLLDFDLIEQRFREFE